MKNNHISTKTQNLLQALIGPKQAAIYLASLETGGGRITDLARLAGMERTNIYNYLEELMELGLLKESTTGKRTLYIPADPARIKHLLTNKVDLLDEALPELQKTFAEHQGKSLVTYYQGKEGIISLYEDVYKLLKDLTPSNNDFLIFSRSFGLSDAIPEYFPKFIEKRTALNLNVRAIIPESEKPKSKKLDFSDPLTYVKYSQQIPNKKYLSDEFAPDSVVMILPNHVATVDYRTGFCSLTENKNLSETWTKFFNYIWNSLE